MTYLVSGGALNSTHSLVRYISVRQRKRVVIYGLSDAMPFGLSGLSGWCSYEWL